MATKTKTFFYQLSVEEAVSRLKTNLKSGLSPSEAEKRLEEYGHNELKEGKRRPMIYWFLDQFKDLLIIVLIVAAGLAYYLDDFRGGTILLIIVLVNAIIGFYQEFKAEKILESLKAIIQNKAIVIRDGKRLEIDQKKLVPGDLVYLEEGASVPADLRLTEVIHFSTNDFILTGESIPQEKFAELVIKKETTLTNQDNLVFMGLTVAKGNAYGIVFGTGMDTAIGRIATATQTIHHDLSPLQKEINSLAKFLTKIAAVIALSLFVINFVLTASKAGNLGAAIQVSLLFAISVAASCVPQGLPAQISVALTLGVGRLAKKKAVVKQLSAVETLGSTGVICSDKTGTITKNEMTIVNCVTFEKKGKSHLARIFDVTGDGYSPKGSVLEKGRKIDKVTFKYLQQFFEDGFLASNGRAEPPDKAHRGWYAIGDPTEAAFTPFAMKVGLKPDDLDKRFPLFFELPFDSVRKRMTVIRQHKGKHIAYMKGAIESVLEVCSHAKIGNEVKKLTPKLKQMMVAEAAKFSAEALRVIALAYRDFPKSTKQFTIKKGEKQFIFAGFVAMIDPPRAGVKEAVETVYRGGMRMMMITGDNEVTALAIAKKIGMRSDEGKKLQVFNGDQIKRFTDQKLKKVLRCRSVIFSRVSPNDKYRIVSLLKHMGQVVAVTGDGVNDTLSLKRADIGVSMGKMGSEVAKEVSEIVLLDDNFHTLTTAISEGRTIFANLKKTILSSITSNNGELFCVLIGFVGVAAGLPAPITAVQILAVDLVGEMLPLTALTLDPAEKSLMEEKPRNIHEHILNQRSYTSLLFYGFFMGAVGYFSFYMVHIVGGASLESGHAAAYTGIILCQFMNILSRRTERTIFTRYLFTNPKLWGSFVLSIGLIGLMIYAPVISIWFEFEGLSFQELLYPLAGALVFLGLHEGRKVVWRKA